MLLAISRGSRISRVIAIYGVLLIASAAQAGSVVGDIQVVYNAPSTFLFDGSPLGILDGPAFVVENTSSLAITDGILSIGVGDDNSVADSFKIGTIAGDSYVVIVPGLSNDGAIHPAGGFFTYMGAIRDSSDVGPSGDGVPFLFTGLQTGIAADTGIFTPAATQGLSNDGTVPNINFLGGPGNNDGPCNNCFGPKVVAEIQLSSVPEPATWLLFGTGFTIAVVRCRLRPRAKG